MHSPDHPERPEPPSCRFRAARGDLGRGGDLAVLEDLRLHPRQLLVQLVHVLAHAAEVLGPGPDAAVGGSLSGFLATF